MSRGFDFGPEPDEIEGGSGEIGGALSECGNPSQIVVELQIDGSRDVLEMNDDDERVFVVGVILRQDARASQSGNPLRLEIFDPLGDLVE